MSPSYVIFPRKIIESPDSQQNIPKQILLELSCTFPNTT